MRQAWIQSAENQAEIETALGFEVHAASELVLAYGFYGLEAQTTRGGPIMVSGAKPKKAACFRRSS
jgi:hypothetical protein